MIKRYPQAHVSGGFVLRVAEADMELQKFTDAQKFAEKALSLGVDGDLRAQALWIKGSVEHQKKDLRAARTTFNRLISEFPNSKLTEGARRLLAMTAEDQDDFETALEQYLALHYDYDVAYFIDVFLQTDRLAKFVASHQHLEQYNKLLYSLGVRYMRDNRWNDARTTLRQVQTKYVPERKYGYNYDEGERYVKDPDYDWNEGTYVKTSWVMQDLKTIDILEQLEQKIGSAQDDESKAEAIYQLASYQYDANSLVFYNPALWRGARFDLLYQLNLSNSIRLPNESQRIFEHSQQHDTFARSIPLYQEIREQFPQTKAAKDALFSEVVAQERLSDLNPYWRDIYSRDLFVGDRIVGNSDIRNRYPTFKWPISRIGWDASTRTVNGGPAYPPPAKPMPKLTFEQRIKRKMTNGVNKISSGIQHTTSAAWKSSSSFLRDNIYLFIFGIGLFAVWKHRRMR